MSKFLLFVIILAAGGLVFGQNATAGFDLSNYGVRIEADKRLIVVLAALEMARTKNEAGQDVKLINTALSDKGGKFRERLMQDQAGLNDDLRQRISQFVMQYKRRHAKATDAELVSPFISMAYTLSPVPEMADPAFTSDLPGDLLDVLDFAPLAREFYRRSGISSKLDEYVAAYTAESDGERIATFPDMLASFDARTGEAVSVSELKPGSAAAIVISPSKHIPLGAGVFDPAVYPEVERAMGEDLARYALKS